jgi:phage gpG-like protein
MGIGITTKFDAQLAIKALRDFENAIDEKVLYETIGQRLLGWINKNFKDEGTEKPWQRLAASTIARRRAGNITSAQGRTPGGRVGISGISLSGAKILQDTGRLKQSFVSRATNQSVIVGTALNYATTHQFGRGRIPARPMLPSEKIVELLAITTIDKVITIAVKRANEGTA